MSDARLENEKKFHNKRFIEDDNLRLDVKKYYSINESYFTGSYF